MLVGSTSSLIVHFSHLEGVSASEELKDVVVCILMGKHSPAPRLPLTACFSWSQWKKKNINNQSKNEIEKNGLSQPEDYDAGDSLRS